MWDEKLSLAVLLKDLLHMASLIEKAVTIGQFVLCSQNF
jgi:hypothetical protein